MSGPDAPDLDGLTGAFLSAGTGEELLRSACALALAATGAMGVAVLAKDGGGVRAAAAAPPDLAPAPQWLASLAAAYGRILAGNAQSVVLSPGPDGERGVFVPLLEQGGQSLCLAACLRGATVGDAVRTERALYLVKASLLLADRRFQAAPSAPPDQPAGEEPAATGPDEHLAEVVGILGEVQSCSRFFEAAVTLCAEAAARLGLERAALGVVRGHGVDMAAVDQMERFSENTRTIRQMEEAMLECLEQDRTVVYPPPGGTDGEGGVIVRAAGELALAAGAAQVVTMPLRVQGAVRLVVLVLAGEELDRPRLETLRLACELTAPRLVDLRAAEEWLPVRLWRLVLLRAADLFGPRHTALKLASACVLLVLALSLSLRGDLTVSAPLTVEGVHSYTHTAPVDSFLVEVRARPGDLVHEGAVLGRLDATEIQLEIAAQEAQYRIHKNQGSHLRQEGKEAESALAELEAEKTAVNLRWARTRLAMTELRASVTGYLVSEDMFPRLGQPVRRGQELFEVADTASLRVVLRVREEDIADLDRGGEAAPAAGEFTLTAYPSERIPFAVERIHPFATVTKGGNGFEVRGTIGQAPPSIALRPGMEGYAQVVAGRLSLLSLWTRKLANKVRLLCWEWL